MKSWNVIVKAEGQYGWTEDVFMIHKKHTAKGAVTAGLSEFLADHDDAQFNEFKITVQLRKEKAT